MLVMSTADSHPFLGRSWDVGTRLQPFSCLPRLPSMQYLHKISSISSPAAMQVRCVAPWPLTRSSAVSHKCTDAQPCVHRSGGKMFLTRYCAVCFWV